MVEPNSLVSENWADSLFETRVRDSRFDSVEFMTYYSKNSLSNAKKIEFCLPRYTGPVVYIPRDMYLKVDVVLTKADGVTPPDASAKVSPVNNILHSLFSECRVKLEDYSINDTSENYHFKSFIIDTLSYDMSAKFSYLQSQGYYQDAPGHMDSGANASFGMRSNLFKNSAKSAYSVDPVTFVGKIHSDLLSTDATIIPGISLNIELTRADNDFTLIVPDVGDTENYQLQIKEASLICAVATLSTDSYFKLQKNLDTKDAAIYYKRVQVQNKAISANSKTFVSENLFSSTLLPSRLILAFLPTTTFLGNRRKNSYNFARKWTYTTSNNEVHIPLLGSVGNVTGTKTIFLEKINLSLNGKSLDGWDSVATAEKDPMMFLRLHHFLGFTNTTSGNNLTLDEFHRGAYFCVYDLSTCGESYIDFVVPSVRLGALRLKVEFSTPTVEELTLLMYAEFPSLIKIDKYRRIKMSFL